VDRLEDQLNDLTELHQHEMGNLKQDMASIEEKIEYRLDERTTDLNDLVDSCQTKVRKSHMRISVCVTDWSVIILFTQLLTTGLMVSVTCDQPPL
jgi:hypothetical protein